VGIKQKIMNLENLNLVELNPQEVQETEGGGFFYDLGVACHHFCHWAESGRAGYQSYTAEYGHVR
jgi:hypothetical protein